VRNPSQNGSGVFHIFEFHPDRVWLCDNPAHVGNSELLVSARKGDVNCINYFSSLIFQWVDQNIPDESIQAVCSVPSSSNCSDLNHIDLMAGDLARSMNIIDGTSMLKVQHSNNVEDVSCGNSVGNYSYHTEGGNKFLLKNKTVLLLDDMTVDMRAILVCERLLLKAGVINVIKLVLGRASRYAWS